MSKLLVEDKDIKSSRSNFAIYEDEKVKFEGKDITLATFSYRLQCGYFQALDIEILNAVYLLKYSSSRQVTQFLNSVRNIDVNQNTVTKRLTILNNSSCVGRYSFISEERISETGLKCYVLRERGKRLLLQREYECSWSVYNSVIILEDIKNYLARNNYILKLLEKKMINFSDINLNNNDSNLICEYKVSNIKHIIVTIRNINTDEQTQKILLKLHKAGLSFNNLKIIFIGVDDKHLFDIFKVMLSLIQMKEIDANFFDSILYTQDLRIIEREINSCFISFKFIDHKLTLEDVCLNEFNNTIN